MFAAYGGRTMANAKFKLERKVDPDVVVRTIEQVRAERRKTDPIAAKRAEKALALRAEFDRRMADVREDLWNERRYVPTIGSIMRRACRVFKISQALLISKLRNRRLVFARQFVMYWARRLTTKSLPEIGRLMGKRDHTTILHGARAYPEKRSYFTHRNLRRLP